MLVSSLDGPCSSGREASEQHGGREAGRSDRRQEQERE